MRFKKWGSKYLTLGVTSLVASLALSLIAMYPIYLNLLSKGGREFKGRTLLPLFKGEASFPYFDLSVKSNVTIEVRLLSGTGKYLINTSLSPFRVYKFNLTNVYSPLTLIATCNGPALIYYSYRALRIIKPYSILSFPAALLGLLGLTLTIRAMCILASESKRK
ncbi:MAG: hypothetical protein B6U69_03890 [Thermofilum sp. ex4484_15]|nr:MAG: hypothetical protein B6U69_03890 [Thermofilum sp. ex4484_15]